MSNVFGVPPPPPSQIFGPRPATERAPAPWVDPDPEPGRRRLALLLAFLAVAVLVFANLATWLHQDGVHPRQAPAVAAATAGPAAQLLAPDLRRVILAKVAESSASSTGAGGTGAIDPSITARLDAGLAEVLASPEARAAWEKGVATALSQAQTLLDGDTVPDDRIVVTFDTTALATPIADRLSAAGLAVTAASLDLTPYTVTIEAPSGSAVSALGTLADLWLVLWIGAIALGAASIAVAPRRLRLAMILAIDAAVMLAVCLLLVPLMRQVVDDLAQDPAQVPVVNDAYDALTASLIDQTLLLIAFSVASAVVLGFLGRRGGRSRARRSAA